MRHLVKNVEDEVWRGLEDAIRHVAFVEIATHIIGVIEILGNKALQLLTCSAQDTKLP